MGYCLFPLTCLARSFAEHEFCRCIAGIDLQLLLKFFLRIISFRWRFGEIDPAKPIVNTWRIRCLLQNLLVLAQPP